MDERAAFDEAWYLTAYPDVAAAVERGAVRDGRTHFLQYGQAEGRLPSPPPDSAPLVPPIAAEPSSATTAARLYTTHELDAFVAAVDAVGGLEAAEAKPLLREFRLSYDTLVNRDLDPYGEDYVRAQVALYQEISGRIFDQSLNELTRFDIDAHAAAANPYGWRAPSSLVAHHMRIGRALRLADLPPAPRVLDLGAGWGLTTEFLAMLGAEVIAVDINPHFIELISRRAARLQLPITAIVGTFDMLPVDGRFDMVLFYEALHHAVRPWQVIARCAGRLKTAGVIAFAAEPIQEAWWPHWGMRLDGVSVYCIRKFGWFESGWSEAFTHDMFRRAGLDLILERDAEAGGGQTGVARPPTSIVTADALPNWLGVGWLRDETAFYSSGNVVLTLPAGTDATHLGLSIVNYRAFPLSVKILNAIGVVQHIETIPCGRSELLVLVSPGERRLMIQSDSWVPAEELDTIDRRRISFHLEEITIRKRLTANDESISDAS